MRVVGVGMGGSDLVELDVEGVAADGGEAVDDGAVEVGEEGAGLRVGEAVSGAGGVPVDVLGGDVGEEPRDEGVVSEGVDVGDDVDAALASVGDDIGEEVLGGHGGAVGLLAPVLAFGGVPAEVVGGGEAVVSGDGDHEEFGGAVGSLHAAVAPAAVESDAEGVEVGGAEGVDDAAPVGEGHAVGAPLALDEDAADGHDGPVAEGEVGDVVAALEAPEESGERLGGPDHALLAGGADGDLAAGDGELVVVVAAVLGDVGEVEVVGRGDGGLDDVALLVGDDLDSGGGEDGADGLALEGEDVAGDEADVVGEFAVAL